MVFGNGIQDILNDYKDNLSVSYEKQRFGQELYRLCGRCNGESLISGIDKTLENAFTLGELEGKVFVYEKRFKDYSDDTKKRLDLTPENVRIRNERLQILLEEKAQWFSQDYRAIISQSCIEEHSADCAYDILYELTKKIYVVGYTRGIWDAKNAMLSGKAAPGNNDKEF